MPKGSAELTRARNEEILNACAALYESRSFKEITLRDIGEKTTFTRTSIYNYFHSKEEIFLALLQREYLAWIDDLQGLPGQDGPVRAGDFAAALAHTLEKRTLMLKLLAMNLYDMEANTRIERLVDFKRVYARSMQVLRGCLERGFPRAMQEEREGFLYALYPFLFGIYPYTALTEKQKQAMELAGVPYPRLTVYDIVFGFVARQLQGLEKA